MRLKHIALTTHRPPAQRPLPFRASARVMAPVQNRWADRNLRAFCILVACLLAIAATGCASTYSSRNYANAPQRFKSSLLFSPYADSQSAAPIYRETWPSAEAGYQIEQEITFTERFHDRQGRNRFGGDDFRRRFTSTRRGHIRR